MYWREWIVLLLFLAVVASVFVGATTLLLRRLLGRTPSPHPAAVAGRWTVYLLALGGLLCVLYGFLEPYWPEVTYVTIPSRRMPPGARFRIAQISDLHCEAVPRIEGVLPELVAAQSPDAIVFTGDAINRIEGLPIFRDCMTQLARIAPTFAVRGNWDVLRWKDADLFGGTGVTVLDKGAVPVRAGGAEVWIAGARLFAEWLPAAALEQAPRHAPRVLLYHLPQGIKAAAADGADLCLVGHVHGGQVRLPGYGALVALSPFNKKYEAGLYRVKDTWLYVNRGIGLQGDAAPRVRFLCRPEITILDLVPEELVLPSAAGRAP
mgnify:CR=1 FL=1